MDFEDVTFPPHFFANCGSLTTTMCHKTVVGGRQGHVPCKILPLQHSLFLCQSNLMEMMRLSQS